MISSADLSGLPAPVELRRIMQSIAVLDAIMQPDWEYRYFSFNSAWDEGEMMGSMRDGSGAELFALFNQAGCFIKGFDHERRRADVSSADFYDEVPEAFVQATQQAAFSPADVTFCLWRSHHDPAWHTARRDPDDGSAWMLVQLDGRPASYQGFARKYYETDCDIGAIEQVYRHDLMNESLARSIKRSVKYRALSKELREIGYPSSDVGASVSA